MSKRKPTPAPQQPVVTSPQPWHTVKQAKVVYRPIMDKDAEPDDEPRSFAKIGVRIDMQDNTHWFFHFKYETWTHHYFGLKTIPWKPSVQIELKKSYTCGQLQREYARRAEYSNRRELIDALEAGVEDAIAEDDAKRAF